MDIDPNNPDFINYTGNKELYNHFDLFNYEDFHPNLQIVKLEDAPFNHDIPLPVDIILTNNPKLTNLMLNVTLKGKKQSTLHITNNSVTHLIISACNMMDLDLDLFMKWIALKRITIWNSACKGVHMNDIETKINQHGSWKCIVYEYSKSERTVKLFKV